MKVVIMAGGKGTRIACFGCPKQEKWIYENIGKYDAKVSVCAGATVDFLILQAGLKTKDISMNCEPNQRSYKYWIK